MKTAIIILTLIFIGFGFAEAANGDKNQKVICGKVIDKTSGEALSGVKVQLKDTNTSCYTDLNGNFVLTFSQDIKTEVVADIVGYEPTLIKAEDLGFNKDISLTPVQ